MQANSEERVKAVLDVFQAKLVKRGISLKALDAGEPSVSGKEYKLDATLRRASRRRTPRRSARSSATRAPRASRSQIQGDELRVSSKSRDDLQAVIALVKGTDLDFAAPVRQLPLSRRTLLRYAQRWECGVGNRRTPSPRAGRCARRSGGGSRTGVDAPPS